MRTLEEIARDMLAWEAEAFEEEEPVSGADLVDVFAAWREELKTALAPPAEPIGQFKRSKLAGYEDRGAAQ